VVQAGPYFAVWQDVSVGTDDQGQAVTVTNSWTELATGLNWLNPATGQYEPSHVVAVETGSVQAILHPIVSTRSASRGVGRSAGLPRRRTSGCRSRPVTPATRIASSSASSACSRVQD